MASIYDYESGNELTTGLTGSQSCDEAIQAAQRTADRLGRPVLLADDDGDWKVYPARAGKRRAATPEEACD